MASERVLEVAVRRHVFVTERPFPQVLDGTMGEMTRHVPDAGSYAPVTLLVQELPDGGTRVAYDTVASAIAVYHDPAATEVAERLDTEVLELLRQVTGG